MEGKEYRDNYIPALTTCSKGRLSAANELTDYLLQYQEVNKAKYICYFYRTYCCQRYTEIHGGMMRIVEEETWREGRSMQRKQIHGGWTVQREHTEGLYGGRGHTEGWTVQWEGRHRGADCTVGGNTWRDGMYSG